MTMFGNPPKRKAIGLVMTYFKLLSRHSARNAEGKTR